PIGRNNVIIGGGATGIELALYIAKYGSLSHEAFEFLTFYKALELDIALQMLYKGKKKVTVLEKLPKLGSALGKTTKWVLLDKCRLLDVNLIIGVTITEIGKNYVNYTDSTKKDQVVDNIDTIYYATGVISNNALAKEIKKLGNVEVQSIGDARKPATVLEAIERAYKIANRI
ncbi:MAG: FAD-dependent oxidoreductase, partial [Promethearchaeota archaeon]